MSSTAVHAMRVPRVADAPTHGSLDRGVGGTARPSGDHEAGDIPRTAGPTK